MRSSVPGPPGPSTLIGLYLRAGVLRDSEQRRIQRDQLRRTGWLGAEGVARAAFEIVVQDAYRPGRDALDVAPMVSAMRAFFGSDGVERFSQEDGEALIRVALGENVDTAAISAKDAFVVHGLIFTGLAMDLAYSVTELNEILVRAERTARERGFEPTPDVP
jgi:hypothetical protein